ncbi:MAG: 2-amino-4-hydroxy-6-hydroxymethyldihydropteridine diphosphokinase [Eubacteriales bacterium]|nr:2-amino-4-hydroxy-6-hydroxymethyldihydropteridine diphosphokinase [Eubacteriales bacterium]
MDEIHIKGLEVFAHHGVFPEETRLGQKFVVSADLRVDLHQAGISDDLNQSIDYGAVCAEIHTFLTQRTFQLLEAAAEQLCTHLLLRLPLLESIRLEIEKPWAPIGLPLRTASVSMERGWHTAYIALGSNIGDTKAYLDGAVEALRQTEGVRMGKVSDYIVTAPYGGVEQDDFLNAVLCARTLLTPHELLDVMHVIEQAAKRERVVRWGPRTLDLDLLFYDQLIFSDETLHIPHPEIPKRDFVLRPMAQIAPHFVHPVCRKTMVELLEALG